MCRILLQQAEKGSFVSPKRYEMQDILALRADYNARREPEGVTSEMAFGKKGELSEELRNFGVAVGLGWPAQAGSRLSLPQSGELHRASGVGAERCAH